jgi:N-dimethylarginine dimethylaminohydrolase
MDENTIIDQLEELIKSFDIRIRREPIKQDEDLVKVVGGLCLLRGEYVLIISSKATTMERINALATALKHFDLDQIYLRPVLRELLDKVPEQKPFKMGGNHGVKVDDSL